MKRIVSALMFISLTILFIGNAEGNQDLLFFEGFENWNNNAWILETELSGTYAIADDHYFEGQYSFKAGPSSCSANCWDHRVTITKQFSPPTGGRSEYSRR